MVVAPGWLPQASPRWATATELTSSIVNSVALTGETDAHSYFLAWLKARVVLRRLKRKPSRIHSYEGELGNTADLECTLKKCLLDEAVPTLELRKFDLTFRQLDFLRFQNRLLSGSAKSGSLTPLSASIRVANIFVQRWENTEQQPLVTDLDSCWRRLFQFN